MDNRLSIQNYPCLETAVLTLQCHLEWIRIGIRKYLTECHCLLCPRIFHILLLAYHFIIHMFDILWQRMAVKLRAAHKKTDSLAAYEVLLACFLLSCNMQSTYAWIVCSTRNIAHVQYTKVYLYAAHFASLDCHLTKLKSTHVFSTC